MKELLVEFRSYKRESKWKGFGVKVIRSKRYLKLLFTDIVSARASDFPSRYMEYPFTITAVFMLCFHHKLHKLRFSIISN